MATHEVQARDPCERLLSDDQDLCWAYLELGCSIEYMILGHLVVHNADASTILSGQKEDGTIF